MGWQMRCLSRQPASAIRNASTAALEYLLTHIPSIAVMVCPTIDSPAASTCELGMAPTLWLMG